MYNLLQTVLEHALPPAFHEELYHNHKQVFM